MIASARVTIRVERRRAPGDAPCLLLHGALSPGECADQIAAAEDQGYAATGTAYPPSYRDNDRIVRDDPALAAALFERLGVALPAALERDGVAWRLAGLNPRFRGCRYRAGQRFAIHRDGPHARSAEERSLLTLMLYLNDAGDFSGGATRFFPDRDAASAPWLVVRPRAGTAIVFDHALWHDGEPVPAGTKYVLRTDVIYRREPGAPPASPTGAVEGDLLRGHAGYVWQVRRLADGRLASAGRDGTVRAWRLDGERLVADGVLRAHPESITALLELPGGALWTGGRDGSLRTWDPDGQGGWTVGAEPVRPAAGGPAVLALASVGERRVAVATADGRITLHDDAARTARSFAAHAGWVWALVAAPDGTLLSGGEDGAVRRWSREGALLDTLHAGRDPVRSLALLPSGAVAWGTASGAIHRTDGRVVAGHAGAVRALLALPDGRIVSGGEDDRVRLWSPTGRALATWSQADFVTALAPAGEDSIVSASYDGTLRLWPLA